MTNDHVQADDHVVIACNLKPSIVITGGGIVITGRVLEDGGGRCFSNMCEHSDMAQAMTVAVDTALVYATNYLAMATTCKLCTYARYCSWLYMCSTIQ